MHRLIHRRSARPANNIWHPLWDLTAFEWRGDLSNSIRAKTGKTSYGVRSLRYWFMDHLLTKEYVRRQRPLDICEVGVGEGHLLRFIQRGCEPMLPCMATTWDAVSLRIDEPRLSALGYCRLLEKDIESPDLVLHQQYDVLILLHVLEHLHEPEKALARLLPFLNDGGIVIGGVPVIPHGFCRLRERQLRKTAQALRSSQRLLATTRQGDGKRPSASDRTADRRILYALDGVLPGTTSMVAPF